MAFFDKKNDLSRNEKELMDKISVVLFGGVDNMKEQITELNKILGYSYDIKYVAKYLLG